MLKSRAFHVITIIALYACSLSDCLASTSSQFSWEEDVRMQDGSILPIKRSVSPGGHHPMSQQVISFKSNGEAVTWERHYKSVVNDPPVILDFVGGDPVIVMPVSKDGPCEEFDYPQEGLVAFRYKQKQWSRMAIKDLPNNLAKNLLGGPDDLEYKSGLKGVRVTHELKNKLDSGASDEGKQGTSLRALIKYYSSLGPLDSCISIRPPPDSKRDAARAFNDADARKAKTIQATLESVVTTPQRLSNEERYHRNSLLFGAGYFDVDCKGVVDRLEPMFAIKEERHLFGNWITKHISGYQFYLSNEAAIIRQVQVPYMHDLMDRLICNGNEIYAISRQNNETLIVYEFTNLGELIAVNKVNLPDANKISDGQEWGTIWEMRLINNELKIVLVSGGGNTSDVLNRQQVYKVQLK